ncbi:MAG: hypothetical protein HYZ28_01540 [Myxococcales bacterium]|nr:hypothetical protein [Myxococcales bacterium]
METTQPQTEERLKELQARVGPQLEQARAKLSDLNTKITRFVRENPGTCLLGALAFGYMVGRLASRK